MDAEDKVIIDREKIVLGIVLAAIVIVIILLLIPTKKDKEPVTVVTGENVTIKLYGDNPYYLLKGKQFNEPGYEAYENNGTVISSQVRKIGTVDTNVPGKYELIYTVRETIAKRTIIVSDLEAIIVADSEEYTNENYNIMISVKGNDYEKTILPDNKETGERVIEYEISENGIYSFTIYDKYNNQIKLEEQITNFDKEGPIGSCTNKLDVGKTYVEVEASDEKSGIASYIYNNGDTSNASLNSKYEYSGLFQDVNVTLIDRVGNKSIIKCASSGEGAMPQIKPPSGANIKEQADSDTLKVSIESKGSYYITRIWVLDPYNQINKGLANWGKSLLKPYDIITNEISKNGYQNKIIVGINGSGFYNGSSWTPSCSSSCQNDYKNTAEGGLAIADGKVLRSWYQDSYVDKIRNDALYAISKEGYIEMYPNTNSYSESARKQLFENIISKGYSNTWMFRPVIMIDGQIANSTILGTFMNSRNKRSVVCQINRNNFAMITATNHGVSELKPILTGLGCQTAFNLDGGGSTTLFFKSKNGELKTLYQGNRQVVDTFYFVEK